MRNKKTILIILGIGIFFTMPVFADSNLIVEFENEPLFDEANFLPGENITRWVKVINNSGEKQRIVAEAININNSDGLGYALVLEITEDSQSRYINNLSKFFNAGEVYLSDLTSGNDTTYNFSITFHPESNNTFQGKSLGFDILVGFQGEGGGLPPGSGGGGGGFLPPGLTIFEPISVIPGTISATITWETSYNATSEVVYGSELEKHNLDLTAENYGYQHTSGENLNKVTEHKVTITGLTPSTTYYYRSISHGSFALSTEYTFTTLAEEDIVIENKEEQVIQGKVKGATDIISNNGGSEKKEIKEDPLPLFAGGLLASTGDLFGSIDLCLLLFILIIILIILILLFKRKQAKSS